MTTGGLGRRPSIKDVAERAGVSFQTVSKVLRGRGSVADDTRQRIHEAADALDYVPDDVARGLVSRRTASLGVIVGDLGDHIVARFVDGAEREARRLGLAALIVHLGPGEAAQHPAEVLTRRRVDGIVAAAPHLERDAALGELLRGIPSVAIHTVLGGGVPVVGSDHRDTAVTAVGHLLSLGHTRVGMITGAPSRMVTTARSVGWRDAHRAVGVEPDATLTEAGDWTPDGGFAGLSRLLDGTPDLTAVYVQNDLMAVGALHALLERGRRVPDDVAVVGCDDIPVAAHTFPPLTTVRIPFAETGAAAVRVLMEVVEGVGDPGNRQLLPTRLVCRRSCGCDGGRR